MPMSNIQSVALNEGALKIIGEIANLETYDRGESVLHVWLAQPECAENDGAGLAIDCFALDPAETGDTPTPTFVSEGDKFRLTVPAGASTDEGVVGKFFQGPATVSVIAVLHKNGAATQVLQWSRIAMLSEGTNQQVDSALETVAKASQGASA